MSMIIAHNMSAINTKRNFAYTSRGMEGAMEKLSSGYKINAGKDDPSGLVISEQLRSQLNGLQRAMQNTEEAINVMGIAEGALNEMNAILKKMKALAIHSANNGVTSPEQVAADQAEMDSSIQTIDRIAQVTKFSDQFLLNGAKDIDYRQDTLVKGTQQNALLNARESHFSQIFKRDGYAVSFNFTGTQNADATTGIGDVDFSQQAMKAYLEIDTAKGVQPQAQVDDQGNFTQEQRFTLTGKGGSRSFKFKAGASVTDLVSQVKSAASSTGIDAALVFNSAQNIDALDAGGAKEPMIQYLDMGLLGADGKPFLVGIQGTASGVMLKDSYDIDIVGDPATFNTATGMYSGYTVIVDGNTITTTWSGRSALVLSGGGFTGFGSGVSLLPLGMVNPVVSFGASVDLTGMGVPTAALGTASNKTANAGTITMSAGQTLDDITSPKKAEIEKALERAANVRIYAQDPIINGNRELTDLTIVLEIEADDGTIKKYTGKYSGNVDISAGGIAGGVLTGDLAGLTVDVAQGTSITGGDAQSNKLLKYGSQPVAMAYTAPGVPRVMSSTITEKMVDGIGNVSSLTSVGGVASGAQAAREIGSVGVFNNTIAKDGTGRVAQGVTAVELLSGAVDSVHYGFNTDGQGRIYVKFLDDNSYELYKDSSLSAESLVAMGVHGEEIREVNSSGLKGFVLNLAGENLATKKGVYLTMAGIEGRSLTDDPVGQIKEGILYAGSVVNTVDSGTFSGTGLFDADRTLITGVELGMNTSDEARIYLKNVYNHEDGTVQVYAYKHKDMRDEDMVAKSEIYQTRMPDPHNPGQYIDTGSMTVVLNEIRNSDNTAGTGLGIILSVDRAAFADMDKSTVLKGNMTFTNLGARVYAQEYGSDAFVKITQDKGAIFTEYMTAGDLNSKSLIDAGEDGIERQIYGQDASLSVNGGEVSTTGLKLNMANQDIQANLVFNGGKVGSTTLAQVGYGTGSLFTKIGALNIGSAEKVAGGAYAGLSGLLCNAGHVTNEKISEFRGGMQLQLGEGDGDQNRTVVAIKSMTMDNLGRVVKGGYWETGNCVWTEKTFTMKDVMGGGLASLAQDPVLAMSIIDQAISDVSETRALLGAMQANLLQTNSNNIKVTMENIQKTESGIRDADMADEMTELTKNQVLQGAGTSMMAQANQSAQNVLQLLR